MRGIRRLHAGTASLQLDLLRALRPAAQGAGVGGHRHFRRRDRHGVQGPRSGRPGLRRTGARRARRPSRDRAHPLLDHWIQQLGECPAGTPAGGQHQHRPRSQRQPHQHRPPRLAVGVEGGDDRLRPDGGGNRPRPRRRAVGRQRAGDGHPRGRPHLGGRLLAGPDGPGADSRAPRPPWVPPAVSGQAPRGGMGAGFGDCGSRPGWRPVRERGRSR